MKPIPRFRCTECGAVSSPPNGMLAEIVHASTCSFVTSPDTPPPPAEMISDEEAQP